MLYGNHVVLIVAVVLLLAGIGGNVASGDELQSPLAFQAAFSAEPSTGITLTANIDGSYSVKTLDPSWTFAGSVGAPLNQLMVSGGADGIGTYRKISFTYSVGGVLRTGSLRTYQGRSIVVLATTFLADGNNTALFPRISSYPQGVYKFGFNSVYGHQYGRWGQAPGSPWAYFDETGNTFIVSPASHFPLAATIQDGDGAIVAGIRPAITRLPIGFTQETMLAVGKGINHTWDQWGQALTDLQGKIRPSNAADVSLIALSYWTDSASQYYYFFDPAKGYEGTLKAVKDDFAQSGIPINSMQLDSWWYPKGNPPSWDNLGDGVDKGQDSLRPDSTIFPYGLQWFRQSLSGIPLMVHARWIDPASPLRQQYKMSGNVSIDPKYWDDLAAYLKSSGVMTYEQDWLASWAKTDMNLTDPEAYLDNMARAMAAAGITVQYCGQAVGDFLQGSKYSNLTTIRVSEDGFNRSRWNKFLYNSRLASSLGIFPFADNVYSADIKSLLLETNSAGLVGVGDGIGKENVANLLQSVRPDGVIVKPDVPIIPMDSTYIADAQAQMNQSSGPPMLASTYADHNGFRTFYVFGYSRAANGARATINFAPNELGIQGSAYVYDYFTHRGKLIDSSSHFTASVGRNGSYYVVAPVGPSGIAFLGDTGKFVSTGLQRITELRDRGILYTSVQFATGEKSTKIRGYSPTPPVITVIKGSIGDVKYDPVTSLFTITVSPGPGDDHIASLSLSGS
jgi:hypothetical protein